MPEPRDGSARGTGPVLDAHHLLLSLAGVIDDELLGWARELVAVGEAAYALDLIIATVAADRIRLPHPVHAALRASRPRVELEQPDPDPVMRHRFVPDAAAIGCAPAPGRSPVDVLHTLPSRLLTGCRMSLTWRLTPAGSASTPVPHPVLLVETGDRAGADVLAHQVTELLSQAGVFVSVEVLSPDSELGAYHRAAMDASVTLGAGAPAVAAPRATPPAPADTRRPVSAPSKSATAPVVGPSATPPRTSAAPARGPGSTLGPVERVVAARSAAPGGLGGHEAFPFDDAAARESRNRGGQAPVGTREEQRIREPRASRETVRRDPAQAADPAQGAQPPRAAQPPHDQGSPARGGSPVQQPRGGSGGRPEDAGPQPWAFGPQD